MRQIWQVGDELGAYVLYARGDGGIRCPHCDYGWCIKWGKFKGRQRYYCYGCSRTFSLFTGTPLSYTRYPEKWEDFVRFMGENLSLREISKRLGIHVTTAFRWRHKLLSKVRKGMWWPVQGIVEIREVVVKRNLKGKHTLDGAVNLPRFISVIIARSYQGSPDAPETRSSTLVEGLCTKYREVQKISSKGSVILGNLDREMLRKLGFRIGCFRPNSEHVYRHRVHISETTHHSCVVRFWSDFRKWARRFRGVRTIYLDNYITWFALHEKEKFILPKAILCLASL